MTISGFETGFSASKTGFERDVKPVSVHSKPVSKRLAKPVSVKPVSPKPVLVKIVRWPVSSKTGFGYRFPVRFAATLEFNKLLIMSSCQNGLLEPPLEPPWKKPPTRLLVPMLSRGWQGDVLFVTLCFM